MALPKKNQELSEIIEFRVRKHIDRIQLSIDARSFLTVMQRTNEFFIFYEKSKDHGDKIWKFRCSTNGKLRIQIVKWRKSYFNFALIVFNPNEKIQKIVIDKLLPNIHRTLSQIEFANDLYPIETNDIYDLRDIVCSGLTLKDIRGKGFNRHDKLKKFEDALEYQDTLYYGSNGFVRRNIDFETGKARSVSKGLTIYLKPIYSYCKTYLRIELRLNRKAIKSYTEFYGSFRHPIPGDLIDPKQFMVYKKFNYEKLENTNPFKKKRNPKSRRLEQSTELVRRISNGLIPTYRHIIEQVAKYHEAISNTVPHAAMPIQIRKFKELFPSLAHRISEFFPVDKTRQQILTDIEQGFVKRYYV